MLKLIAPRPTFAQDMTEEERTIMKAHSLYWRELMNKGFVLAFGPVLDTRGVYGLGIIEADTIEQVNAFMEKDPAIQINTYEVFPMLAVVPEK